MSNSMSQNDKQGMTLSPAPAEALLDFDPSNNDIDARLFENIVEDDYMMHSGKENSSIQS